MPSAKLAHLIPALTVQENRDNICSMKQKYSDPLLDLDDLTPIIPERMIWTASSVRLFRRCKRKFFWKYIMRLSERVRGSHLMIGSAFHEAVATWYRAKRVSPERIAESLVNSMRQELLTNGDYFDQSEYDDIEVAIAAFDGMFLSYTQQYEKDKKSWKINPDKVEYTFLVSLDDFDYAGQQDLLTRDFVVEHKTSSNPGTAYFERLPLDTQCRGYVYAAQKEGHDNINSVLYNVIRKTKLKQRQTESHQQFMERVMQDYADRPQHYYTRVVLKFSKRDIRNFEAELRQTHAEYSAILSSGAFNNPRAWLPNDSECNSFFKLCPYFFACLTGLKGGRQWLVRRESLHEELKDLE